ncbi:MAG: PilZ domain-containing protein [Candidatus Omnitrophica bacterium]|nr:PilZ domain-containing protein [Candidatus Omnitrophota bacterium]
MNKRLNARYECRVPLLDEKREVLSSSQTTDISKSGVGFVSACFIPANTNMMVELSLTRDGSPVLVQGRVKWVERMKNSSNFRVGMVFPDISPQAESRIENCFKD